MTFYIHIFNLITGGVLTATLITLCFVLADDLHINILKFVTAYGTIVQPASINIVFGCKQAQKYSQTHHLGFIGAVSLSAQNTESHWPHVHITLTVERFSFHTFCKCRLQRDFDVFFQTLNVTKTINIPLAHFRILKKLQTILMLLGILHAAPPLPKSPLISSYQQQKHLA